VGEVARELEVSMKGTDLLHVFDYDEWATTTLLDAVAQLGTDEIHKDLGTSFQSLHGTLVHLYGAQLIWLSRWKGSPTGLTKTEEISTLADLRTRWRELYQDMRDYLRSLTHEQLQANFTYKDLTGKEWSHPLFQQIEHLAFHSMYHRGQVVTLLRQLGQTPPHTDLIVYYRMQMAQAAGSA
jgi:uncharacterized damage-inducible protein DinB